MCSACILVTELSSNSRSFGGKRVVLTDPAASTERAFGVIRPAVHSGFPLMRMSVWTLSTAPPYFASVASCYLYAAKVSILSMVPLTLQLWGKLTDVWTVLPVCIAVYESFYFSARSWSACLLQVCTQGHRLSRQYKRCVSRRQ